MGLDAPEFIGAIAALSTSKDVQTLRALMEAGCFDFPDPNHLWLFDETRMVKPKTAHGNPTVDALAQVLENTHFQEVHAPGVKKDRFQGRDNWIEVWVLEVGEEYWRFHEDLCSRLTDQAMAMVPSTLKEAMEEKKNKVWLCVVSTLGGLLCTACAMGNALSTRKIAKAFPSTMGVAISSNLLGQNTWDWFKSPNTIQMPMVNPYFFAAQFSEIDCMDALEEAGHDPTGKSGFGTGAFNLPALLRAGSPACRPDVLVRILQHHMESGDPKTLMKRQLALYDTSKKMAEGFTNRHKSIWEIRAGRYHWAFVLSGVFALKPNESAILACAEGLPDLLVSVFRHLAWKDFFRAGAPWPLEKATQYGQNFNFEDVQSVMLMFLAEAVRQGWEQQVLAVSVRVTEDHNEAPRYEVTPIEAMISCGMDRVLRFFIDNGFNPHARLHPKAETAMEFADRKNARVAFDLRTEENHHAAHSILDWIDAESSLENGQIARPS